MYLVHAPVIGTTFALAAGLVVPATGRVAVALLAVALSVGAAVLLHRYVEAPCAARSQRVGRRPAPERTAEPVPV
jgi:peptidoglycan/LPS O-acetylase OafA/YrhL